MRCTKCKEPIRYGDRDFYTYVGENNGEPQVPVGIHKKCCQELQQQALLKQQKVQGEQQPTR